MAIFAVVVILVLGIYLHSQAPLLSFLYISDLRSRAEKYKPPEPKSIEYAADLDTASHKSGILFPIDIKLKQLQVLEEAGIETVRITLAYDIFLQSNQDRIDDLYTLISRIRDDGKRVMIADGAAELYWNEPMDWDAFSHAFIERVADLAARFQPEYYIVVKEPTWYMGGRWTSPGGMLTEMVTVDQWLELTRQLCDAIKAASPGTQRGIAIALPFPESQDYLMKADKLEGLDFVGIDIYSHRHIGTVEGYVQKITKPKWILESWDGHPDTQIGQRWRTRSAAEWIKMISHYAQSRDFVGLATFYNLWLCYDYGMKPRNFDQVRAALDNRRKSFYALQTVIRSIAPDS